MIDWWIDGAQRLRNSAPQTTSCNVSHVAMKWSRRQRFDEVADGAGTDFTDLADQMDTSH